MRIPSPDEAVVEAADRLLAIPQERGVPLPKALIPLLFIEPAGLFVATGGIVASGALSSGGNAGTLAICLAGMFALSGAFDFLNGIMKARTLSRHAAEWSPELVERYAAEAYQSRDSMVVTRYTGMVFAIALTVMAFYFLVVGSWHTGALPYAFAGVGMAVAWIGRQAQAYGDCALPLEPNYELEATEAEPDVPAVG